MPEPSQRDKLLKRLATVNNTIEAEKFEFSTTMSRLEAERDELLKALERFPDERARYAAAEDDRP